MIRPPGASRRRRAAHTSMARMPHPTHGVLFDVGYTLLDETDRLRAAVSLVAEDPSVAALPELAGLSPETRRERVMSGYLAVCENPKPAEPSLLVLMLESLGLATEEARRVRKRLRWDATPMTELGGARACLQALRDAGLRVGVLANQPASAREDLERAGLIGLCDHVWLSDAVGMAKPDPAFFRLALSMWSLPPGNVAYVGDRPDNDVAPAKALGMHTVRLRVGPHATQQPRGAAEVADWSADSMADVQRHLLQWSQRTTAPNPPRTT